jgi:undecaprenyl-diphosphatase
MDLSLVHTLNHFFAAHDAIEDPVVAYERIAQLLFVGILAVLFFVVRGNRRQDAGRAAVSAGAATVLALAAGQVITHLVFRSRPFVADPTGVHLFAAHAADSGFPSDHATASFAIATAVMLRDRRWGAIVMALAAVLAVGRVAMAVHYPTDVLAGAALGALSARLLWIEPIRQRLDALADRLGEVRNGIEHRLLGLARAPGA